MIKIVFKQHTLIYL